MLSLLYRRFVWAIKDYGLLITDYGLRIINYELRIMKLRITNVFQLGR
jgi:hypothetical protein